MLYQHWLAFLLSLRGEVVRQQPRREGDTWSRRVGAEQVRFQRVREQEWRAASACFERKLYGAAADWIIAASGNGIARIYEEAR